MLIKEIYDLDKSENSPIIALPWFKNCRVMIDTGSTLPIWLRDITTLKIKGAEKQDLQVILNGVGGKSVADLYRVNFDFGSIHFRNMPIVHKEMKVANAYMLLPASLFEGMIYEIDNINHKFTVKVDNDGYYRELNVKTGGVPSIYLTNVYKTEEEYNTKIN